VTITASNTLTFNTNYSSSPVTTFYLGGLAGNAGTVTLHDISLVPVTLSIVGSGSSSFSGLINGTGNLTVSGGSLDLYGNTEQYDGPTTVTAGLSQARFQPGRFAAKQHPVQ